MSDDDSERIDGLDPRALFRAALGDADRDPQDTAKRAEEERRLRAEIERRLPDLELLELLGRGGMGFVYRARQTSLDRDVALKVVAPDADRQTDFTERFAREARALARLSHPNIVAVHGHGQNGPICWLVMEYVDGSSLRDVMAAGKLEPKEALALVPKICDALQYAHDRGVVHRDIKPENILLDREGSVKIADFGLAKLVGTPAALVSLTGSQQVLGTLRYMAPEQLDRPLEVDHRADIYSLGVVIYEMLTSEIPMGRFDPPSLRSSASREVDEVVLRTLEREPERRYQRASAIKSDLESVDHDLSSDRPAAESLPPGAEPAAELSALAVASSVLLAAGVIPFLITSAAWLALTPTWIGEVGSGSPSLRSSLAGILLTIPGVIGSISMVIACALGFTALGRIRRAWPHSWGVGAAVVGAWAGALVTAAVAVVAVISRLWEVSAMALVAAALLLLGCAIAFLVWYRLRFLDSCRLRSSVGR